MIVMKSTPVSRRTRSAYGCRTEESPRPARTEGDSATLMATASAFLLASSASRSPAWEKASSALPATVTPTTTVCSTSICLARLQRCIRLGSSLTSTNQNVRNSDLRSQEEVIVASARVFI